MPIANPSPSPARSPGEYLTDTERLLAIVRPSCGCGATATTTFNGLAVCAKCHERAQHHHSEAALEADLLADWTHGEVTK